MTKILYEPKKDLKNWLRIKDKYPESFTITKHYPFDKDIILKKENFRKILSSISKTKTKYFNIQAKIIKKTWQTREDKIINKITDYLSFPFSKIDFKANLTTAYLMPYDYKDKWFMIPTHKGIEDQILCLIHELFHLYQVKKNPNMNEVKKEKEVKDFLKNIRKSDHFKK
ncbi:MAG: hypothetical protein U5L76_01535 [Patescibacteria group bacterium]|nr:hypothetical protein [Patescibacteria group bacterium]